MWWIAKKQCFTLLELLVVLFLLSFGVLLTGVKIKEMYQEQRFVSEVQQVLDHIKLAQDLMLILDTDVLIKMAENAETKNLNIWLEMEKPVSDSWFRLIERKLELQTIRSFIFEHTHSKELSLEFSLGRMSKGILVLSEASFGDSHASEKRTFELPLAGYPTSFGTRDSTAKVVSLLEKSQRLYPVDIAAKLHAEALKESPPITPPK